MEGGVKRAVKEIGLASMFSTVFCLLAEALFAVFVKAFAPSLAVINGVNWAIQCVSVFVFALIFLHVGKTLLKGILTGVCSVVFTMLIFLAIGGGSVTVRFVFKLLICAVVGVFGAALGTYLRKE